MEKSRVRLLFVLVLLALIALLLLLMRCDHPRREAPATPTPQPSPISVDSSAAVSPPPERLTPAVVTAPVSVVAGATFSVKWEGPENPGDFVAVAKADADPRAYTSYIDVAQNREGQLKAPVDAGTYEVRYVAHRSGRILGRAPLAVKPATASVASVSEANLNTPVTVEWTGPANAGDFLTIVPKGADDPAYGDYKETTAGSPVVLTTPREPGDAEVRYVTGQGHKVLARHPVRIKTPDTSVTGPARVVAGARFTVAWTGPNSAGDFVTVVAPSAGAGEWRSYQDTSRGTELQLTAPIEPGTYELRYVGGRSTQVLARASLEVVAAQVSLVAPQRLKAGERFEVTWTGPDNAGDYITVVPLGTPDTQYASYVDTSRGHPARLVAPEKSGPVEIRYVSGQGPKVLMRIPALVTP